jgi:hypothetical protein
MFLDLRLKIQIGRDRHSSMTDWIKQAAQRAKTKRDKRQQYVRALDTQLSGFWTAFYNMIKTAVDEFNDEDGTSPLMVEQPLPTTFIVRARGAEGPKLEVSVEPPKGSVQFAYTKTPETSPGVLYFDMDSSGVLCFFYNEQQRSREDIARMLLEPLFDAIY